MTRLRIATARLLLGIGFKLWPGKAEYFFWINSESDDHKEVPAGRWHVFGLEDPDKEDK